MNKAFAALAQPANPPSLIDLMRARAAFDPNGAAFELWTGVPPRPACSNQELDQAARAIAGALQTAGMSGRRALVMTGQGALKLAALCGCLYAGVVAIVVPPEHDLPLALARLAPAASLLLSTEARLQALPLNAPEELLHSRLDWLAVDMLGRGFAAAWRPARADGSALALLECSDPWAEPACMLPMSLAEVGADPSVLIRAAGLDGLDNPYPA
ncbi:MAG: hypothetical protein JNJ60_23195 [Rhodocyclaceae bacterium]|nr:hypothetical protein [Rhodocyclaceae bacterium]